MIAVILTIMVLEVKAPSGTDWAALQTVATPFLAYVLSFVYVAIYWNNHHHFFHLARHVTGGVMWANLHLLFWLSLIPFTTSWVDGHLSAPVPTALYGFVLLMTALAWHVMQRMLVHEEIGNTELRDTLEDDRKGKISIGLYVIGVACAFVVPWIADLFYIAVAAMWLIPDRRVENTLIEHGGEGLRPRTEQSAR